MEIPVATGGAEFGHRRCDAQPRGSTTPMSGRAGRRPWIPGADIPALLPRTLANRVALRLRSQTARLQGAQAWSQSYPEMLKQAVMPLPREQVVANE